MTRSINNPEHNGRFEFFVNGVRQVIDLDCNGSECGFIYKHVCAFILTKGMSVVTVTIRLRSAAQLNARDLSLLVGAGPTKIGEAWDLLRGRALQINSYVSAKWVLQLLCAYGINGRSPSYSELLRTLPLPFQDKFASVRSGDVFLSANEEALIVKHLDQIANQLIRTDSSKLPSFEEVTDAGMLLCAYQFAMRPIQIAMLNVRNVRIWKDQSFDQQSVHLTFHMAKQRNGKRVALTRKVKNEWTPIFTEWQAHLEKEGVTGSAKFFQVRSSREVGLRVSALVRHLIDSDGIGSVTDLRHTAAQRLVDAGANHEELANFLGHAQTDTGLVYYTTSVSHAERVNRALGISEVYRQVAKIAHDRFISAEELFQLKGEQQIAAVPHGVPIAGIGGCQSGQPACPFNPVTSCYGCRKFMPVVDKQLHENVLAGMREIVLTFEKASRGDTRSPAYMQLQRTIAEIQNVITELEEQV